jgi:hypothetical protein
MRQALCNSRLSSERMDAREVRQSMAFTGARDCRDRHAVEDLRMRLMHMRSKAKSDCFLKTFAAHGFHFVGCALRDISR